MKTDSSLLVLTPTLIETLKDDAKISKDSFDHFLEVNQNNYAWLVSMLVEEGYVSRKKWGEILGELWSCAYLPLNETITDESLLGEITEEFAKKYTAFPVYKFGELLTFAITDPFDRDTLQILANLSGQKKISRVFSFKDEIQAAIDIHYGAATQINSYLTSISSIKEDSLEALANKKEVVKIVDTIIYMALKDKVSDIHIEQKKHGQLLRFRKDGVLFDKIIFPLKISPAITSRLKIMAGANIAERRLPQDGRFEFKLGDSEIDIRVSFLPTQYGEKVVLRLLGAEFIGKKLSFEDLGFSRETICFIEQALNAPNGMLFVTGPTGSGKTTTLHCALNYLASPEVNIVTLEDPIEYEHPNITQTSVNRKDGRDFSSLLRAVLRQDPDVIMIGEIRDLETARIAANAALTGHMVLTSLHTNNAIQAMTRLIEMGVEHFVVAPSVIGVLAQRLVRKICSQCKESYEPSREYMASFFDLEGVDTMPKLFRGKGCNHCHHTGFSGRTSVHEFLGVTNELRDCILRSTAQDEFYEMAIRSEFYYPFAKDGLKKVLMGLTTIEEVMSSVNIFEG